MASKTVLVLQIFCKIDPLINRAWDSDAAIAALVHGVGTPKDEDKTVARGAA
jgi:hypothetical protein